ncbi:MAG TPA: hypothetical protein VI756_29850 [Blastocatellia bacterium]
MAQPKILYLLVETNDKTYWNRAGAGFLNNDGSINIKLDMFPGLTFNLKDPKPNGDTTEEPSSRPRKKT